MRFDCIRCRKATIKPQGVKGAFVRMLTFGEALQVVQQVWERCPDPDRTQLQCGSRNSARIWKTPEKPSGEKAGSR